MNYCFEENSWGERFIPELNRSRFEQECAASLYARELEFDPLTRNRLTIIIGSDSGLLYKYLLSMPVPEGSRIILLEPCEVIDAVSSECVAWQAEHRAETTQNSVSLLSAGEWQAEIFNEDDVAWFMAGSIELIQSGCAVGDYQNIYYPLYREVREALSNRAHAVHNRYSHKIFIEQQMANCVDCRIPLLKDPEFGKKRVALIMGGGPSLDEHLEWIIENRSRLFIIAVSRLCTKLESLQLFPDIVIAMDPSPLTYAAAKLGTQWQQVPLVHSYHVAHLLPKQWRGPRYFVGARFPWDQVGAKNTDIVTNAGPTVGHAATVVASELGFTTILLSGVDLCMNADGDSHTQGTPEAELLKLPGNYDAQVTTYAGNQAGTSIDFFRSIEALENIGQHINAQGDILFNLNVHAAMVPSIRHIDCRDVELPEDRPHFDCSQFSEVNLDELTALRQELNGLKKDILRIRTLCAKALRCVDQIYGKPGNPAYHQRLDALESRLEKVSPKILGSIRYLMGPEYARLRKPAGFSGMGEEEMETWARDYYQITDEGARFYQKSLGRANEIISLRQAELASEPNIDYLLQEWQAQETPGRIMLFQEHLLTLASLEQRDLLQEACAKFLNSLQEREKQHDEQVVSNYGTIGKTMQSLRYLRNKGCVSDLYKYSEKLKDLEWPYGTIAKYIKGSIAEMAQDIEQAIIHYQSVIDDCAERLNSGEQTLEDIGSLIENTLTCLTQIYLERQQGDDAASTLGMLAEISPQYIPSYANLLAMLDNHESAVELLTLYLENYGRDWRAARQLAKIHETAGNADAQRLAAELADTIRESTQKVKAA